MKKKSLKVLLVLLFSMGLTSMVFAASASGVGKLNIWISDVADACGIWNPKEDAKGQKITIFDCDGIFRWECGRYRACDASWQAVPNGLYQNLPSEHGHLEAELPPGCYWVIAGGATPNPHYIHLNYTSHIGIVQVKCGETTCLKLFNPSIRTCWNWFRFGLLANADQRLWDKRQLEIINRIDKLAGELLQKEPMTPTDKEIEKVLKHLRKSAEKSTKK